MERFKKIKIEDKNMIDTYLEVARHQSCDYSAANLILWGNVYDTEYCIIDDMLIMKYKIEDTVKFTFPVGAQNHKSALEWILKFCEENDLEFNMNPVEPHMFEIIEELFPGRFHIEYNRDGFDYVYNREDLENLVGKKYHGKKNHINKFMKMNPEWQYEDITDETIDECRKMIKKWCVENNCCDDDDKAAEICVAIEALENMKLLNLTGGLIRTKDGVVALTIGEAAQDGMYIIHFEKAFAGIQGAYPMINQQFIQHQLMNYRYINREEDLGVEGLRKAKESYYPEFMVEKGTITAKK